MALASEVPDRLASLARRVPFDTRVKLSKTELVIRCEEAADLLEDGNTRQAVKVLEAMDLQTWMGAMLAITEQSANADDQAKARLDQLAGALYKEHPQPAMDDPEMLYLVLSEILPQRPKPSRWRRLWSWLTT